MWDFFPLARGPLGNGYGLVGGWRITSTFGGRPNPFTGAPSYHGGEDLAYAGCAGAPIYAPFDGWLVQGWDSSGGGNWSGITRANGEYVGIGHASSFAMGAGSRAVKAGTLIARVGTTGASTGPHAHIAWRPPGQRSYADPWDQLYDSANRIVGERPAPIEPTPTPTPPPLVDEEDDDMLKLWRRSDSPDVYAVGLAAKMGPDARDTDLAYHGGVFRYKLAGPFEAALIGGRDWGSKVQVIDVATEPDLVNQFENLALIYPG